VLVVVVLLVLLLFSSTLYVAVVVAAAHVWRLHFHQHGWTPGCAQLPLSWHWLGLTVNLPTIADTSS
jgi:hypothetical protein